MKDTKDKILKNSLTLFKKNGFEKTTMRQIAKECELSLGSTYYYFRSKEDLILEFYKTTSFHSEKTCLEFFKTTKSFENRFLFIITDKFSQLKDQRHLVKILAKRGVDFDHPLSPFSPETKETRDSAIANIQEAINNSDIKINKVLKPHLAYILWLYQMGLILYWANDNSDNQKNTSDIVKLSLPLIIKLINLTSNPLLSFLNKPIVKIITIVNTGVKDE